jgi:hypothetical protein
MAVRDALSVAFLAEGDGPMSPRDFSTVYRREPIAWADLMARAAIAGSADAQAKLAAYHEAEETFDTASALQAMDWLARVGRSSFSQVAKRGWAVMPTLAYSRVAPLSESASTCRSAPRRPRA